jgi:hypothetical protein
MNNRFRKKALEIIENQNKAKTESAAIEGLAPEVIEAIKRLDSAKEPGPDYMALVKAHKLKHGGSIVDAMRHIEREFPHKRREYLRKHNPGLDID